MRNLPLVLLIGFILSGCATGYQKQGWTGGYNESQLQKDMFRVSFKGNAFVNQEKVEDYLLLRCAEITIDNGFDYFVILDQDNYAEVSSYTTPTNIESQSSTHGTSNYSGDIRGRSIQGSSIYSLQGSGIYSGQTHGKTTITGGETYHFSKPTSICIIRCFKGEKPKDLPNIYVAYELIGYLKDKR